MQPRWQMPHLPCLPHNTQTTPTTRRWIKTVWHSRTKSLERYSSRTTLRQYTIWHRDATELEQLSCSCYLQRRRQHSWTSEVRWGARPSTWMITCQHPTVKCFTKPDSWNVTGKYTRRGQYLHQASWGWRQDASQTKVWSCQMVAINIGETIQFGTLCKRY